MFVRSRSNLNVQVLFLRREKIGAPAEKTSRSNDEKHKQTQDTYGVARVIIALGC